MSLTQVHIDLIHRQISGELSPEEEKAFNQHLTDVEGFKTRWLTEKSMLAYVEAQEKWKLKQELTTQFDQHVRPKRTWRPWSQMQWASAAAVLIIGISAIAYFFAFDQSKEELFYEYYAPYPAQGLVRSDLNESVVENAVRLYDTGSYERFVESSSAFSKEEYPVLSIYLGIAFFELGRADLAMGEFSSLTSDHPFYAEALWYSALIFLHEKNLEDAVEKLEALSRQPSVYRKDAEVLLKDLR